MFVIRQVWDWSMDSRAFTCSGKVHKKRLPILCLCSDLWIKERRGRICYRMWGLSILILPKSLLSLWDMPTGVLQPLILLEPAGCLCGASRCLCAATTWVNPQSPGWGRLPCCCPAIRKGLFSQENDFWSVVSCPRGLHSGESLWSPCQQTFCSGSLWKWDETNQISGVSL